MVIVVYKHENIVFILCRPGFLHCSVLSYFKFCKKAGCTNPFFSLKRLKKVKPPVRKFLLKFSYALQNFYISLHILLEWMKMSHFFKTIKLNSIDCVYTYRQQGPKLCNNK